MLATIISTSLSAKLCIINICIIRISKRMFLTLRDLIVCICILCLAILNFWRDHGGNQRMSARLNDEWLVPTPHISAAFQRILLRNGPSVPQMAVMFLSAVPRGTWLTSTLALSSNTWRILATEEPPPECTHNRTSSGRLPYYAVAVMRPYHRMTRGRSTGSLGDSVNALLESVSINTIACAW